MVRPEIQLMCPSEQFVVNAGQVALKSRSCVRNQDVHTTKMFDDGVYRGFNCLSIGDIAFDGKPTDLTGRNLKRRSIDIKHGHFGPVLFQNADGLQSKPACRPGYDSDLPVKWLFRRLRQFCLFERPILNVKEILLGKGDKTSDPLSAGDDINRCFGNVGRDRRLLGRFADTKQADARNIDDPRNRIERAAVASDAGVVSLEILAVIPGKISDCAVNSVAEPCQIVRIWSRCHHSKTLDSD